MGKGTGLGLSTVRDIVISNRGAVWATSVPGAGATFTVCLPRVRLAPVCPETSRAERRGPHHRRLNLGALRPYCWWKM